MIVSFAYDGAYDGTRARVCMRVCVSCAQVLCPLRGVRECVSALHQSYVRAL